MKISIMGVKIDQITSEEAINQLRTFVQRRAPHQVVTVNPEFIMRARRDTDFRSVLNRADLALADGAGLLWASRVLRSRNHNEILKERITGTDLVPILAKLAAKNNWSVYLLGGYPGVASRAATILKQQSNRLRIAGAESGPIVHSDGRPVNQDQASLLREVIGRVRQSKPDILFVAFGAPKQDRFIARYKEELDVPVMIGVGGAFDFLAGRAHRAPKILQILWLEWLWRLIREPWRLHRIWTAVVLFPLGIFFELGTKKRS